MTPLLIFGIFIISTIIFGGSGVSTNFCTLVVTYAGISTESLQLRHFHYRYVSVVQAFPAEHLLHGNPGISTYLYTIYIMRKGRYFHKFSEGKPSPQYIYFLPRVFSASFIQVFTLSSVLSQLSHTYLLTYSYSLN